MPSRADVIANTIAGGHFSGAGTNYLIKTPNKVLYLVIVDAANDVSFIKSSDGGRSWSARTSIFSGTVTALSVWYDRWSGIAAGLIHVAWQESVTDDTLYRTINTESADALSTQTTILAGTSTLAGGCLSICRARGGNVYCATMIDAGSEGGFFRLPNANVPNGAWDAARATIFEAATTDMVILMPGWAADNQGMMAFYFDNSAVEISRKLYDDSANSWSETSIATSMSITGPSSGFPHFAGAVDIANSRNLLAAWSGVDLSLADLRCFHVTESAITEVTNVVLNGTDDQGLCAIGIDTDTGDWYVFYCGKSDGTETWIGSLNIYYKRSTDSGSTWGAETKLSSKIGSRGWLACAPRFVKPFHAAYYSNDGDGKIEISALMTQPRASHQLIGG